ncbi:hypothetical protein JYG23_12080 [Sedimentibacter sp. zth1]|uniref:hypothetical protein n=1 Tax=Sedimentibacter sp. zth1 TaxID=2816908 RepID=UPI001A92A59B|nr:hypothetical protein [Sedimentibacter sp. zth1]QSX05406.1 hypothetical protein JYG23_12080 [Sedimentibacter sp. zth1]
MKNIKKIILMMLVLSMLLSAVAYAVTPCPCYEDGIHKYFTMTTKEKTYESTKSSTMLNSDGNIEFVIIHIVTTYLETPYKCACGDSLPSDYKKIHEYSYIEWTSAILN